MKKTKTKMVINKKQLLNFRQFIEKNVVQLSGIMALFMVGALLLNSSSVYHYANVLSGQKSAEFTGTVLPVQKSPNWVALSSAQWKLPYNQLPQDKLIDLPKYTPSELAIPFEQIDFGSTTDKNIRNAQVTFSVPYMGNYKLDGKEYAGSHLAVDIKIPLGTPVYAIANAVVVKAATSSTGFGNNLVLRHDDVPSIDDQSVKTTYYSGYAHLQSYDVSEGEMVQKGQLIGYSGESGTGTTPHLHFQIDNDQAPWHIYWPYTSKEASDAGYSFYEAVNAGFGRDKAMATTINPLVYVQTHLNSSGVNTTPVAPTPVTVETVVITPVVTAPEVTDELPPAEIVPTNDPVNISAQPTVEAAPVVPKLAALELKYSDSFKVDAEKTFKVIALDENGNVITAFKPTSELYLKVENGSATLNKTYLKASDFNEGVAEFSITPTADFGIRVSVSAGNVTEISKILNESSFTDVNEADHTSVAINFLKTNGVVRGYSDGSFKPKNPVSRVEALKFIYEGLNKDVKKKVVLEFSDTDSKAWYARYIASAQQEGVVKGYQGNIFKPANPVTRAEFVKMLMEAAGYSPLGYEPISDSFTDVAKNDWYYSYVSLAAHKNLIGTSTNKFRPNEYMTREEVSEVLYKMILVQVKGDKEYSGDMVVNAEEVVDFYTHA